jgi:tRNA pseudouridine38-40 synthase
LDKSLRTQILIRLAYDGVSFFGVPRQNAGPSVQAALEARFREAFEEPSHGMAFTARTDQGVSALANYATCWLPPGRGTPEQLMALCAERPDGLIAVQARFVHYQVHARALGEAKHYRYRIQGAADPELLARFADAGRPRPDRPLGVWDLPLPIRRTWQVAPPLDPARMAAAIPLLLGEHDFRAFAAGPFGTQPTRRNVQQIRLAEVAGPQGAHLCLDVIGEGFLRNMVRVIAGTLAEIGAGLREPEQVTEALTSGLRDLAGQTAPARALTLVSLMGIQENLGFDPGFVEVADPAGPAPG